MWTSPPRIAGCRSLWVELSMEDGKSGPHLGSTCWAPGSLTPAGSPCEIGAQTHFGQVGGAGAEHATHGAHSAMFSTPGMRVASLPGCHSPIGTVPLLKLLLLFLKHKLNISFNVHNAMVLVYSQSCAPVTITLSTCVPDGFSFWLGLHHSVVASGRHP